MVRWGSWPQELPFSLHSSSFKFSGIWKFFFPLELKGKMTEIFKNMDKCSVFYVQIFKIQSQCSKCGVSDLVGLRWGQRKICVFKVPQLVLICNHIQKLTGTTTWDQELKRNSRSKIWPSSHDVHTLSKNPLKCFIFFNFNIYSKSPSVITIMDKNASRKI